MSKNIPISEHRCVYYSDDCKICQTKPNTTPIKDILLEYNSTHRLGNDEKYFNEAVDAIQTYIDNKIAESNKELLDALYWMYSQYCSGGHDFMGAGEDASELLEKAGYITVDGAGRILKDFGDSFTIKSNQSKGNDNG